MPIGREVEIECLDGDDGKIVLRAVAAARKLLDCGQIGIEVCGIGAEVSRKLNRRYRGKNKVATVLSFALPSSGPGGMAGQVLLCTPAVRREARRIGIPYRAWLAELAVHGFLHVLGHQHDSDSGQKLMFSHQRAVLNMIGRI